MNLTQLNANLTDHEDNWSFVGARGWKQDARLVIYPPVWSYANWDRDPTQVPNLYAHELAREDYAILRYQALEDTDMSVEYKCPYGAVIHGGIVFRAIDSARCYVLDIEDLERKGQEYEFILWRQDNFGYPA